MLRQPYRWFYLKIMVDVFCVLSSHNLNEKKRQIFFSSDANAKCVKNKIWKTTSAIHFWPLPYLTPSLLFFNISLFFNLFAFQLISLILLILFRFLWLHFGYYLFFRLNRLIFFVLSLYLSHYISQNFLSVFLSLFVMCCSFFFVAPILPQKHFVMELKWILGLLVHCFCLRIWIKNNATSN